MGLMTEKHLIYKNGVFLRLRLLQVPGDGPKLDKLQNEGLGPTAIICP